MCPSNDVRKHLAVLFRPNQFVLALLCPRLHIVLRPRIGREHLQRLTDLNLFDRGIELDDRHGAEQVLAVEHELMFHYGCHLILSLSWVKKNLIVQIQRGGFNNRDYKCFQGCIIALRVQPNKRVRA